MRGEGRGDGGGVEKRAEDGVWVCTGCRGRRAPNPLPCSQRPLPAGAVGRPLEPPGPGPHPRLQPGVFGSDPCSRPFSSSLPFPLYLSQPGVSRPLLPQPQSPPALPRRPAPRLSSPSAAPAPSAKRPTHSGRTPAPARWPTWPTRPAPWRQIGSNAARTLQTPRPQSSASLPPRPSSPSSGAPPRRRLRPNPLPPGDRPAAGWGLRALPPTRSTGPQVFLPCRPSQPGLVDPGGEAGLQASPWGDLGGLPHPAPG